MSTFTPQNPLEAAMIEAQAGRLDQGAFLDVFMNAYVVVLADQPLGADGQWASGTQILMSAHPEGYVAYAVFTHNERVDELANRPNQYTHRIGGPLHSLLKGASEKMGLVVNPGSEVGLELGPEELKKLRSAYGLEGTGA